MTENEKHYITRNIKSFYRRRFYAPVLYLAALAVLWHVFSLTDLLFPAALGDTETLEGACRSGMEYVTASLDDLKFTGYTSQLWGRTTGYYYYTMRNEECIIVLLSPKTSEQGLPEIGKAALTGKIIHGGKALTGFCYIWPPI